MTLGLQNGFPRRKEIYPNAASTYPRIESIMEKSFIALRSDSLTSETIILNES